MTTSAVSAPRSPWHRARSAYAELIAGHDPVIREVSEGAVDLRPGWNVDAGDELPRMSGLGVISGPDDLTELRQAVERMTGPNTWPVFATPDGFEVLESHVCVVGLRQPARGLALVMSMNGLVVDRSGAWRTWKTVVDSIGSVLPTGFELTFQAQIVRRC